MAKKTKQPLARDAEQTRRRILDAAKAEFARKGLGGARVDEIAARSKSNKRMIYHYFGSKERLFTAVLEAAYTAIRMAERKLKLDELDPEAAIRTLIEFTWNYYLANPEFLTLVNSENLHRARHIKTSAVINVGMATIAAFIGAGGYGERIVTGLALNDNAMLLAGAVPAAALALLIEGLFRIGERIAIPKGLRYAA